MANFPSNLAFASLLQYHRAGNPSPSVLSRDVTYKIKQDGYVGRYRIIDFSAERLAQEIAASPVPGELLQPGRDLGAGTAGARWSIPRPCGRRCTSAKASFHRDSLRASLPSLATLCSRCRNPLRAHGRAARARPTIISR